MLNGRIYCAYEWSGPSSLCKALRNATSHVDYLLAYIMINRMWRNKRTRRGIICSFWRCEDVLVTLHFTLSGQGQLSIFWIRPFIGCSVRALDITLCCYLKLKTREINLSIFSFQITNAFKENLYYFYPDPPSNKLANIVITKRASHRTKLCMMLEAYISLPVFPIKNASQLNQKS